MKAIQVKYLPATNTKPTRLKAWAEGGNSAVVSKSYELDEVDNYKVAAKALMDKLGWHHQIVGGGLPNGNYCFVMLAKDEVIALL